MAARHRAAHTGEVTGPGRRKRLDKYNGFISTTSTMSIVVFEMASVDQQKREGGFVKAPTEVRCRVKGGGDVMGWKEQGGTPGLESTSL